ncbi:MAG: hypothetical protein FD152_1096 [Xanthobacteraceae bacterium]|nr:MAG: hypothetical protein FD152_1096 [Xanthobacteraceae bacterium]
MVPRLAILALLLATAAVEAAPIRPADRLEMSRSRVGQPVAAGSVMVVNRGSRPVWVLQVTPTDAGTWGPDRLGSASLPPGGKGVLRLGRGPVCHYDLRAAYAHGGELTRFDVDLCNGGEVVLTDADLATPLPPARDGLALYRITNRTGSPIVALHSSPVEGPQRGDMLGAWVMAEAMHYTGRTARSASCAFDLRSVFSLRPNDGVTLSGVNLCDVREVILPPRSAAEALSH